MSGATVALIEVMKTFTPIRAAADGVLVRWILADGDAVSPGQVLGWLLRYPGRFWLRINPLSTGPSDRMDRAVAASIQKPGEQYKRVALAGLGTPRDDEPGMGRLLKAWRLVSEAQQPTLKVRKALHKKQLEAATLLDALDPAVEQGLITRDEADRIRAAEQARYDAIQVDVFDAKDYYRDAADDGEGDAPMARAANQ